MIRGRRPGAGGGGGVGYRGSGFTSRRYSGSNGIKFMVAFYVSVIPHLDMLRLQ